MRETVRSCADDPCLPNQTCVGGFCVVLRDGTCDASRPCTGDETCALPLGRCVEPPPCGRNDACPAFEIGAICARAVDSSDLTGTCLLGRCLSSDDCPAALHCVFDDPDGGASVTPGWCLAP